MRAELAIVETLKAARRQKALKQSDLARALGMDPAHLSRIENGKIVPSLATLVDLARALDLELMLVPRATVAAVQSLTARPGASSDNLIDAVRVGPDASRTGRVRRAYELDGEEGGDG